MILKIIAIFLATSLSFFLFYFSVPYWAGSDMAELSSSGIWRAFYRFLSKSGYLIHRLCETVYNALPLPKAMRRGAIGACTNLLFYVVILYLLISGYSNITNSIFPEGTDELASGGNSAWDVLCSGLAFLRLVDNLMPGNNLFAVLAIIAVSLTLYTVINTLFFSILFGLLHEKVDPLGEKGLLGKLTIVRNLRTQGTIPLTLLAIAAYSVVASVFGFHTTSLWEVFLQVLDEIELIPIVMSFLITNAVCRGVCIGAGVAVRHMPASIQGAVKELSDRGNKWCTKEDLRRASKHVVHSVVTRPPEPAPTKKSPEEYIHRKLERYWDDMMEYGDQLAGLDRNSPTLVEDFIQKNFPGRSSEDLVPSLIYLCAGMERDELEIEYKIL